MTIKKVIGSRCLVHLPTTRRTTESGIQLITEEEYKQQEGTVIAIGEPGPLEVGDRILFEKFAGDAVDLGDTEPMMIVNYADVLAIL